MTAIASFVFNPFFENTYVLYDDSNECVIMDPGCSNNDEEGELVRFIETKQLKPVRLINTHCHVDHMLGNAFVASKWNLDLEIHQLDEPLLEMAPAIGDSYGIKVTPSPKASTYLEEGQQVKFGNSVLDIYFTPGHSPGSISFYCPESKFVVVGDVLFQGSIGRYDFPASNYEDLMHSITEKLYKLPDETDVYSGHGESTTIHAEKATNPFVLAFLNS
jgi:glyoxylase-like metal-dependent hydrolase (beta-lactamase superfamily II)